MDISIVFTDPSIVPHGPFDRFTWTLLSFSRTPRSFSWTARPFLQTFPSPRTPRSFSQNFWLFPRALDYFHGELDLFKIALDRFYTPSIIFADPSIIFTDASVVFIEYWHLPALGTIAAERYFTNILLQIRYKSIVFTKRASTAIFGWIHSIFEDLKC